MGNPRSGLSAQWGFAEETAWGTYKAPDTFLPLVSETLTAEPERLESQGIIAGRRVLASEQWAPGRMKVGGGIQTELYTKDIATLIKHFMGDSSSPYTPGDLFGLGLTIQVGVPDVNGTVQPKTYIGAKVTDWQLAANVGEIATLGFDVVAARESLVRTVTDGVTTESDATITSDTAAFTSDDIGKPISGTGIPSGATIASVNSATSAELSAAATATGDPVTFTIGVPLATATFSSGLVPVTFIGGSVTIGGTAVPVKKQVLTANNGLNVERFFNGSAEIEEPLESAKREYMAELEIEFPDLTHYRRYLNGTEHALVLNFAGAGGFSMVITTNVRYDGKTPNVSGTDIVMQNLPMKCVAPAGSGDSGAISIALTEAS